MDLPRYNPTEVDIELFCERCEETVYLSVPLNQTFRDSLEHGGWLHTAAGWICPDCANERNSCEY